LNQTLPKIDEMLRMPSPAPTPFGLAYDGELLWMASRETDRLYAIEPKNWTVREEAQLPGKPAGIAILGDQLRLILGFDDDDDRYIYRFIPGHGLKSERLRCPDLTGGHLAYDGDTLFLSQATFSRILALDAQGAVLHPIPLPRVPLGMTIVEGCFYLITSNNDRGDLRITRVEARGNDPIVTDLARVPFDVRSLTYDGSRFWTSHRKNNQIVAFEVTR